VPSLTKAESWRHDYVLTDRAKGRDVARASMKLGFTKASSLRRALREEVDLAVGA